MRKILLVLSVPVLGILIFCASVYNCSNSQRISPKILRMAKDLVFEVIIEKPQEDNSIYDKELEWDAVPYKNRNEKYFSIGTAFAISKTELMTAFHVIDFFSLIYDKYFIRDSHGNVYMIDQITGGSKEKDFVIFTVKDKTFKRFFKFKKSFRIGMPVFSIGNAFGEGIVIRNGLILSTIPEEDSGRWNLIKSSADVNPGNSGGPLIASNGRVVALVSAKWDNILYSIPSEVILDHDRSLLDFRVRGLYAHYLIDNWLSSFFDTGFDLPDSYPAIREALRETYKTHYDSAMDALFERAPEYLRGDDNDLQYDYRRYSNSPEVSYIDSDNDEWTLSQFDFNSYYYDEDGYLLYAQVNERPEINFYRLFKPKGLLIQAVNTNPRYIMDTILKTIRTDRFISNDRIDRFMDEEWYRILSYGEPESYGLYKDAVGRTWITAYWFINYKDEALIMYILPQPNGPTVFTARQASGSLYFYEWDLKKLCDHIFVSYNGTYNEWMEFLELEDYIPDFLKDEKFEPNRNFRIVSGSHLIREQDETP